MRLFRGRYATGDATVEIESQPRSKIRLFRKLRIMLPFRHRSGSPRVDTSSMASTIENALNGEIAKQDNRSANEPLYYMSDNTLPDSAITSPPISTEGNIVKLLAIHSFLLKIHTIETSPEECCNNADKFRNTDINF
jgi:hypothetical protein